MPSLKLKPTHLQGAKVKKSLHGPGFNKRVARRKIGFKLASHSFTDEIEKVTAQIGTRLKEHSAKLSQKKGRHVIGFNVIFEGKKIRVVTPEISDAATKLAPLVKPAFDPHAAGRKLVADLQAAEGGAWTGAELQTLFGLTPADLHKRRSEYRIVVWRDAKNQFHYPKWQFNPAGAPLPGVQKVVQTFRSSDEWRVMRYFLAPRHQLDDRTPLSLLRAGEVENVVAHAKAHGEENSW